MSSRDRVLFGTTVRQQTKTEFLNLSDLQEAYTQERVKHGWVDKNITMILNSPENLERIFYILEKQNVIKLSLRSFIESVEKQGFAKYMKSIGIYKTTGARHTKTTWVNPYIWTLVALELNPKFYAEVVGWLTDKLILNRVEAGAFYIELSAAVAKFSKPDYISIATALNYIVFNRHESGIRNSATQQELNEMRDLEAKFAFAINMGYIKTQDQLLEELRKTYHQKWGKQKKIA
jgi:hypothetical protein